ncbi:MAG: HEPN domain-containing protein [Candidatus Omnitrophica bacterium]|nr:HEPN domain-containing protein [Candidatus Omnitrophota bacterium]
MNRGLVLAEWRRGLESLEAAKVLANQGWSTDSISRAYYATLHAAKAVLQVHGVVPESHSAVRRMFGLHLIQSGEVEKEWATILAHTFDDRIVADYDVEVSFDENQALEEVNRAQNFQDRMREYLISKGFASSELDLTRDPC